MSNRGRLILAGVVVLGLFAIVVAGPTTADAASRARAMSRLSLRGGTCDCCAPKCSYDSCITYNAKHQRRSVCCGCGCQPQTEVTLVVADPATCDCAVEVPVCIPACCEGDPCVTSRCGVLGRRIVWYEWDCGFKTRVVFNKHNEITVTSYGA